MEKSPLDGCGLTLGWVRHSQLGVKLRKSATPLRLPEQRGAGLASAAASGKLVFEGAASTASQECKLLMDRKFLEFMLL